ncbi:MAG: tetratricopeptide repeat protein [Lysobacteraceae bacterium]
MSSGSMFNTVLSVACGLLLTACAGAPAPREAVASRPPPPSGAELLRQMRALAAEDAGMLDVQPLRDPLVEDLRRQAEQHERAGRFDAASEALRKALALTPGDPELSQLHAEMLLARGQLDDAERGAWEAFESGPRVGSLCRRNWATVQAARSVRGDEAGAAKAAERIAHCAVRAPVRM